MGRPRRGDVLDGVPPVLAVGTDGSLGVTYQADAGDGLLTARFAHSTDGGSTWGHTHVWGPFEPPADPGYYQETASTPQGYASIFIAPTEGEDMPDAYVAVITP